MNTENIGDTDMREHFERLITKFVDLSAQARELDSLKVQIAEVQNRLQELGLTNQNLQSEITQAWDAVRSVERERDDLRSQVTAREDRITVMQTQHEAACRDFEDRLMQAHQAITARDGTIADLSARLEAATRYGDEQFNLNARLRGDLDHWQAVAASREAERNAAQQANAELQRQVSDLTAQLRDMEAKLAKVRSIFEPVVAPVPLTVAS